MYIKARKIGDIGSTSFADKDKTSAILEKLKIRAQQIDYGTIVCEIQIHQGQIRQVDITKVTERVRAD